MIRNIGMRTMALILSVLLTASLSVSAFADTAAAAGAGGFALSATKKTEKSSGSKKKDPSGTASSGESKKKASASEKKSSGESGKSASDEMKSSGKTKKTKETTTAEASSTGKSKKTKETASGEKDSSGKTKETTVGEKNSSGKSGKTKKLTAGEKGSSEKSKKSKEKTAGEKDSSSKSKKSKEKTEDGTEKTAEPAEEEKKQEDKKTAEPAEEEKKQEDKKTAEPAEEEKKQEDKKTAEPAEEEKKQEDKKTAEPAEEEKRQEDKKAAEEEAGKNGKANEDPKDVTAEASDDPSDSKEHPDQKTEKEKEIESKKENSLEKKKDKESGEKEENGLEPKKENEPESKKESEPETREDEKKESGKDKKKNKGKDRKNTGKETGNASGNTSAKDNERTEEAFLNADSGMEAEAAEPEPQYAEEEPRAEAVMEETIQAGPVAEEAVDEVTGDLEWMEDEYGNVYFESAEDYSSILVQAPLVTVFLEPVFTKDFRFLHIEPVPAFLPDGQQIYAKKSSNSTVVGVVKGGSALVSIIEEDVDWTFVEADYVRGFVRTSNLMDASEVMPQPDQMISDQTNLAYGTVEELVNHMDNPAFNYTLTTAMETEAEKIPVVAAAEASIYDDPEGVLLEDPAYYKAVGGRSTRENQVVGILDKDDLAYNLAELEDGKVLFIESGNVRGFIDASRLITGEDAEKIVDEKTVEKMSTAQEKVDPDENRALYYTVTSVREANDIVRQEIVAFALQFVGNPYKWGGTDLIHGTDCSGFVMRVYQHFGYNLPRTSFYQRGAGMPVYSLKEAKAGDLICYNGHVALYIGNGMIVHASNHNAYPVGGIKVSKANVKPIVAIRRILE